MLTVIATLQVRPNKEKAFEDNFKSWAKIIKENEPGTLRYWLSRDPQDPNTYYALELYADEAALETHMRNLEARTDGPADLLAGPPQIKVLNWVGDAHEAA